MLRIRSQGNKDSTIASTKQKLGSKIHSNKVRLVKPEPHPTRVV